VPAGWSFFAPLVLRLSTEYGLDEEAVREQGAAVLASFTGCRVRAFVPVLVEKRLRETLRGWDQTRRLAAVDGMDTGTA
jgi:hypothetical protein